LRSLRADAHVEAQAPCLALASLGGGHWLQGFIGGVDVVGGVAAFLQQADGGQGGIIL